MIMCCKIHLFWNLFLICLVLGIELRDVNVLVKSPNTDISQTHKLIIGELLETTETQVTEIDVLKIHI